jgi:hypothetical protein
MSDVGADIDHQSSGVLAVGNAVRDLRRPFSLEDILDRVPFPATIVSPLLDELCANGGPLVRVTPTGAESAVLFQLSPPIRYAADASEFAEQLLRHQAISAVRKVAARAAGPELLAEEADLRARAELLTTRVGEARLETRPDGQKELVRDHLTARTQEVLTVLAANQQAVSDLLDACVAVAADSFSRETLIGLLNDEQRDACGF